MLTRPAAVAGSFYPADPVTCQRAVQDCFAANTNARVLAQAPKALIVPHAGFIYSGAFAAQAYQQLQGHNARITRVVLLGPNHRVALNGAAIPSVSAFATPLGAIPLDIDVLESLRTLPGVIVSDEVHAQEHSLEVQLPLLQHVLKDFTLVPIVIGQADAAWVAQLLATVWGSDDTLIVISTDLSHYHPYAEAQQIDAASSALIEAYRAELRPEQACGARPLNGLLQLARQRQMRIERLCVKNSGDSAGTKDRVVGYGAYALFDSSNAVIDPALFALPGLARRAIEHYLAQGQIIDISVDRCAPVLQALGACFVTLTQQGKLRGCIGSLQAHRPLVIDAAINAISAASRDPRFNAITTTELTELLIEVSILTPPEKLNLLNEAALRTRLRPGIDGLTLNDGKSSATFLPSVWEQLPSFELFLSQLKRKAGWAPDYWSDTMQVSRYQAMKIRE